MPRQEDVAARPFASSFWTDASSSFIRPTTRKRMSFFKRFASSRFRYSLSSVMSVTISNRGRFQFSTENAYNVRASRCSRAHVSTVSRTDAMPARWPSTRGEPRWRAQRPLPSMMIAM